MDWSLIDDSKFEDLACAYAKDNYGMYKWIPTGKSWDENTDATFRDKIDGINHYYKGWCEAKYTSKPDSSIPKSHMDSTLVSGILDGEVVFILFVTNGKIANSFVQGATAILRPHKIEIKFVDGFVLTGWLKANPDIQNLFFGTVSANEPECFCKIEIADCCVLNSALPSPALISGVKKLHTQTEYFLYLNILSTERASYSLEVLTDTIRLLPNSIYEDIAMPGYNSVLVKFIAKYPCKKMFQFGFKLKQAKPFLTMSYLLQLMNANMCMLFTRSNNSIFKKCIHALTKTSIKTPLFVLLDTKEAEKRIC